MGRAISTRLMIRFDLPRFRLHAARPRRDAARPCGPDARDARRAFIPSRHLLLLFRAVYAAGMREYAFTRRAAAFRGGQVYGALNTMIYATLFLPSLLLGDIEQYHAFNMLYFSTF